MVYEGQTVKCNNLHRIFLVKCLQIILRRRIQCNMVLHFVLTYVADLEYNAWNQHSEILGKLT